MKRSLYLLVLLSSVLLFACTEDYQPFNDAEISVRLPSEPAKLNILYAAGQVVDTRVATHIFPALVDYDPVTLEIIPLIASERPTLTKLTDGDYAGGLKMDWRIREEAKWDDGSPVTGEDFYFTLKCIVNPKAGLQGIAPFIDFVKDIKIDPDNPKQFSVYGDSDYFLSEMAVGNMPVLPRYLLDPKGVMDAYSIADLRNPEIINGADSLVFIDHGAMLASDKTNRDSSMLNSCGAYQLESWTPGSSIVLRRKANWWGNDLQHLNHMLEANPSKITFQFLKDEPGALTMLKDGQLDAMNSISPTAFQQLTENDLAQQALNLSSPPLMLYYFVAMHMKHPILKDVKVRKALTHLTDYQSLIDNVLYGRGERIAGPLHPSHYGYNDQLELPDYNIDKAAALLDEAGWIDSNGNGIRDKVIDGKLTELKLELLSGPSENAKNICLVVQQSAEKGGVAIEPVFKDIRAILTENIVPRNYDMFALAWSQIPGENDPTILWHTKSQTGGRNWTDYGDENTDAVIDELIVTTDPKRRVELYHQWQADVVAAQPYIFLCAPQERIAINKKYDVEVSAKKPGFYENLFEVSGIGDQLSGQ